MASCLPSMSCFIGQSLASEARYRDSGSLRVIDTELGAGVHAKIELGQVPIKVLLVHMLVDTNKAALEDREEPLKGIGVNVAASPFVLGVIDRMMLRLVRHDGEVGFGAIGVQAAIAMKVRADRAAHVAMVEVHGTDVATALNQREHHRRRLRIERSTGSLAGLGRLGQIGFVSFDRLAGTTDRASIGSRCHRMANTVSHEPSSFHAAAEHPLQLAGADAFLGRTHQEDRLQPVSHRDVAVLENGANFDGELLTALIALAQSWAGAFARELAYAGRIAIAAVRAHRARGPKTSLYVFVGGVFIFEVRGVEIRIHAGFSDMEAACA